MQDVVTPRRALISVSDKAGAAGFARALAARGVEILSTGGTARALREAGLDVTDVSAITGFPEIMGGRVKTLHPKIHGAILGRPEEGGDAAAMAEHGIEPIDIVAINLYPFERTIAADGVTEAEATEQIDIGGPAMLRAAAKNHARVAVVTDPSQYAAVLDDLESAGGVTAATRRRLAAAAFARTAAYDAAIAGYFERGEGPPPVLRVSACRTHELRYGENPHQPAAAYASGEGGASVLTAEQLHGKPLSYNNLADAAAALDLAVALRGYDSARPAAVVVKHTNPCGAAQAGALAQAVRLAIEGDPLAAYGGILAVSAAVDAETADRIAAPDRFFEVIVAPSFDAAALRRLRDRWANVRLLATGPLEAASREGLEIRSIPGGFLAQARDALLPDPVSWTLAAGPEPGEAVRRAAGALELVCRALSSNAVLIGGVVTGNAGTAAALFGAGAGQMDRVASCRLALEKAGGRAAGAIAVGDAFFPFSDGPAILADAGVGVLVHPGGSKRDEETLELCREHGLSCLLTGVRRFRH